MYAGITLRRGSGRIIGVHQRIDRAARRHLNKHIPKSIDFPKITNILYFEGKNGPDAIKRKSPSQDEPWHFIDPTEPNDRALLQMINDHIINLAKALRDSNDVRAAFESAWLAHAVVDGLTPPHHYPLDKKIEELWGKPHYERMTTKDKNIIKGINRLDTISKNWKYWRVGGIFMGHIMFEMGVISAIDISKFKKSGPKNNDINRLNNEGFETLFVESLNKIHNMKMYDEFSKNGWTMNLAIKTKKVLIPEIIKVVTLAWCQSVFMATEPL